MESKEIVTNEEIGNALKARNFTQSINDGRLMLAELLVKAGAGYYNSHTEEGYLKSFDLLKKDRTPNKNGRRFLCSMLYKHSNNRPDYYELMRAHRQ